MSTFNIGNVNGDNNVFGDKNHIKNINSKANTESGNVLTRDDYFKIILEIRELERISLETYLEDKYAKSIAKNPDFVKILYKDISKVIDGIYDEDFEMVIEDGDIAIEQGDFKIKGNPTNLPFAQMWLYMNLLEEFAKSDPLNITVNLDKFRTDFLAVDGDTPGQKKRIRDLRNELIDEKKEAGGNSRWRSFFTHFNDIVEMKPNISGFGINMNAALSKILNSRK